ncbi:MAG: hypothetical protein QOI23_97, partial [Chloroflexota bacterium]|nr:hypothetical protein [Chloroflexota bacterium]
LRLHELRRLGSRLGVVATTLDDAPACVEHQHSADEHQQENCGLPLNAHPVESSGPRSAATVTQGMPPTAKRTRESAHGYPTHSLYGRGTQESPVARMAACHSKGWDHGVPDRLVARSLKDARKGRLRQTGAAMAWEIAFAGADLRGPRYADHESADASSRFASARRLHTGMGSQRGPAKLLHHHRGGRDRVRHHRHLRGRGWA